MNEPKRGPGYMHQQLHSEWIDRLAEEARILGEARMLRDDQELTPEIAQAIITRVKDFKSRHPEWPLERIGRSLGRAESVISQVLSGTYAADSEPILRKLDKWLEAQILKENAPKPAGFVKLEAAMHMIGFAKKLHQIGGIGVIVGPSSCGKSIVADYLCSDAGIPGSIRIRLTPAGNSKLAVLDQIAQQVRLTGLKLTAYQVEQQLRSLLNESGRLLIVDEAHELTTKKREEALHELRALHDDTGCPLLLIGTTNLSMYLINGRSGYQGLDQLSARVAFWLDITEFSAAGAPTDPGNFRIFSVEDMKKVVAAQQLKLVRDASEQPGESIGMTPDALAYLARRANARLGGGLRTVKYLLLMVQSQFHVGDVITAGELERLQAGRMGSRLHTTQKTVEAVRRQQEEQQAKEAPRMAIAG